VAVVADDPIPDPGRGQVNGRVLAVDPGDQRIGLAISDLSGTIANPLRVIQHVARAIDAALITQIAAEEGVVLIIVGQPLDDEGEIGPAARKSGRLAEAIRQQTDLPIKLWDESLSTLEAVQARRAMGARREKRSGHLDELAATVLLQSYLDAHSQS
jgi:putative Holliday junction resolvase